jgi:hypothetical protein
MYIHIYRCIYIVIKKTFFDIYVGMSGMDQYLSEFTLPTPEIFTGYIDANNQIVKTGTYVYMYIYIYMSDHGYIYIYMYIYIFI